MDPIFTTLSAQVCLDEWSLSSDSTSLTVSPTLLAKPSFENVDGRQMEYIEIHILEYNYCSKKILPDDEMRSASNSPKEDFSYAFNSRDVPTP